MCSDMAALTEAVERYEVEISVYQSDILATSHGMICCCCILVLVIEVVAPLLLKLQQIF